MKLGYTIPFMTRLEELAPLVPTVEEARSKLIVMRAELEMVKAGPQPGEDMRKWIERRMKTAAAALEGVDAI